MKNNWLFLLILLTNCGKNSTQQSVNDLNASNTDSTNVISQLENSSDKPQLKDDNQTGYSFDVDTLVIGSKKYIVTQNTPNIHGKNDFLSILTLEKDTVYKHGWYATNGFELEDFDNDGVLDIRLYQITNVGGISELIMYDKSSSSSRAIKNFTDFPSPTKIKNTKYWYSYHRSGCADNNWGSELFKIENFVAIELGYIEGIGCEHSAEENGIFIFKLNDKERERVYVEKREPGYYDDKWDFIENYWTKNYKVFE